jgi:hypothetical protein
MPMFILQTLHRIKLGFRRESRIFIPKQEGEASLFE